MFNDNASDLERQKKLEELIRKVADEDDPDASEEEGVGEASEIPSFE